MNQDLTIQFIISQIKKTQQKADQILSGRKSDSTIENFFKESSELKSFIYTRVPSEEISLFLKKIPDRHYKSVYRNVWDNILSPRRWLLLYNSRQAKNKVVDDIRSMRHQYVNLEILLRGLTN